MIVHLVEASVELLAHACQQTETYWATQRQVQINQDYEKANGRLLEHYLVIVQTMTTKC